jgi:hypothetical protein
MNLWVMMEALRYVTSALVLKKIPDTWFLLYEVYVLNKYRAMIRSEIKTEAIACKWEGSLKCKSQCTISPIYAYKCVFTHFHNFAVYVHRRRVGNKAVSVEYVLTGDVRLCACSNRSTFLSVHSKVDLVTYRSKTQHVVRKSVRLDEYVGGISTDMAYL